MYCNNRIKNSTQEFWYRGMELRQIEFFLQLYKDRNITVASQNLYISQQGMSKSIANLEKEVGFPLFKRSVSGVKPTAEAGELYSYFRTVMKSYAGLQSTAPEESLASLQERLFACGKFLFTKETLDK